MLVPVTVRVSASHPDVPLREIPVFQGSACSVGVLDVPAYFGGVSITGVEVALEGANGAAEAVSAVRAGGMWVATFSSASASVPGRVTNGLTVTLAGKDEQGVARSWVVGKGDVEIISAASVPVAGVVWQHVRYLDSEPSTPLKGDLAKIGGAWKLYNGTRWETIGGGGGAVESVNGKTGDVVLTGDDIAFDAEAEEVISVSKAISSLSIEFSGHAEDTDNPHGVTAAQVGALPVDDQGNADHLHVYGDVEAEGKVSATTIEAFYSIKKDGKEVATEDQLIVAMELVGNAPYTVQLDGVVQTFDQVKTLAETRHAVIRRGQGTYRPTYIGANEMMWDVTGTVQGDVLTGQIHMWREGNVVQRVDPKTLATDAMLAPISEQSAYPMADVVGGALKDRTINYSVAGGTFTFPARTGANARDFVLVIGALSDAPTVTFPGTPPFQYVSDQPADEVWTADAGKVNAWYFSEISDGVFMVLHKVMDYVAQ